MGITPDYLKEIADAAEDLIQAQNKYILDRIIKRLMAVFEDGEELTIIQSSLNDIKKLEAAGMLYTEIEEEIKKRLPTLEKELNKAFKSAAVKLAEQTQDMTKAILKAEQAKGNLKGVKIPDLDIIITDEKIDPKQLNLTKQEIERIEAAYKRTKGEVKNLTATMPQEGYNSYINACDNAYWAVRNGVSPSQAVADEVEKLTKNGVTCVEYNSGRKDRVEVAVARAVRTGVNQMTADVTLTRCAEMGVSHVKVSQHYGARVTKKEDYTNHAHWQGKVYYLDWNNDALKSYQDTVVANDPDNAMNTILSDIKKELAENKGGYPDFMESCGYKKMLGICGINCRHTFTPFYEGINEDSGKKITEEENKARYDKDQKARAMEKEIINKKLQLEELKNLKETAEIEDKKRNLKNEILDKMDAYNAFVKENKLPNHTNRMRVNALGAKMPQTKKLNAGGENIVHNISDNAIKNVRMPGTTEINEKDVAIIKDHAAEVLKISKEINNNFEVGQMLDEAGAAIPVYDFTKKEEEKFILGTAQDLDLDVPGKHKAAYVFHNHPNNNTFSDNDIIWLFNNPQVKYFVMVKNNGGIEILINNGEILADKFATYYNRLKNEYRNVIANDETIGYNLLTKSLLKKIETFGLKWVR